ncbi:MAG: metal-dependent hydrolase, partial [Burkholderiales bacterium PBB5]
MAQPPGLDTPLPLLGGYPEALLAQVRAALAAGALGRTLQQRYPEVHTLRRDAALYAHASALKARYLKNAPALAKVAYDNRLQIAQRALG